MQAQSKQCAQCGATFHPTPGRSRAQWARQQFCTGACANTWRAQNSEGAGARFNGGPAHGQKVAAGIAGSPVWQAKRARRLKREAKHARRQAAKRAVRDQRAQLELLPRQCEACTRPVGKGVRYCEDCTLRRKREQRDHWNRQHPDYQRLYKRAHKVLVGKAKGRCTQQQAQARFDFYGGCCAYCRTSLGHSWHWDHVIPLSQGGTKWPANLRPACAACNQSKCAKPLGDWQALHQKVGEAL